MANLSEKLGELGKYSEWALLISPWILFLACYLLNTQWVITKNALSDFGGPAFTKYYLVYDVGLIIIAIMMWFMALGIVSKARNKIQVFGGAFWFVAGIFLALIGYYHEGTYPHVFVSTWFFAQAALSITIMGIGAYPEHDLKSSAIPIIIAIFMPLGVMLVHFPSAATTEIYEIIIMDIWLVFSMLYQPVRKVPAEAGKEALIKLYRRDAMVVGVLATIFFVMAIIVVAYAFS